jgi:hypothetical protein
MSTYNKVNKKQIAYDLKYICTFFLHVNHRNKYTKLCILLQFFFLLKLINTQSYGIDTLFLSFDIFMICLHVLTL